MKHTSCESRTLIDPTAQLVGAPYHCSFTTEGGSLDGMGEWAKVLLPPVRDQTKFESRQLQE